MKRYKVYVYNTVWMSTKWPTCVRSKTKED